MTKLISRHAFSAVLFASAVLRAEPTTQPVSEPPTSIFVGLAKEDRDAAIGFYKKYLDVGGLSIVAGAAVEDRALYRTRELVGRLLAGRPDILAEMQKQGTRLIIIGRDQVYTDMPDYRHNPDPAYMNERVRGTGGLDITSFGEENLLNLAIDRYDDESIAVHEFCHTIDAALAQIDPTWRTRLEATYSSALEKGRWKLAYASSNPDEYWAEIAQSYFDCNRVNNWNHQNVGTREQLKAYDPEGYELVRDTFRLNAQNDWRFTPIQRQPSVITPPGKFNVDPYFTKFTYARELPIVASARVSDVALLRANVTVRKLFAYRQDILKAIINDGGKLVVIAPGERLADLPTFKARASTQSVWDDARLFDYSPELKTMAVPEESVMGSAGDRIAGADPVVRILARAIYLLTAHRPVDPQWGGRPAELIQQYEKRVERLDERFGTQVEAAFQGAKNAGLWRGTPASTDTISYWSSGVEAYFDAAGNAEPPLDSTMPIHTRDRLKAYDPKLFELVERTFAYAGHVDWRVGADRLGNDASPLR